MEWGFTSIDGSKFLANNPKDNNSTKNKLDDREECDEAPKDLTREVIAAKLQEAQERLARYESYQKLMEETGVSQLSLTDADARLMKNKNGFAVSYNPQTAVDSETHLIRDFEMTNQVTDHGMLSPTMEGIRSDTPAGEILRQKSIKKSGNIRYANKNACKHSKNRNKCYKGKGEWKEIDFIKDTLEKPSKEWLEAEGMKQDDRKQTAGGHFEKVKVVKLFLKPSLEKMSQRMCLSEHPFGTIKRAMGATYFLLKGLRKVTGEFALFCLGYNIERA